jgi:hypothetical protein
MHGLPALSASVQPLATAPFCAVLVAGASQPDLHATQKVLASRTAETILLLVLPHSARMKRALTSAHFHTVFSGHM